MNGAECLLRTLLANGVDTCFMNPGTSEMQFVSALDRVPEMRAVLGLFEGVCSGAADGYARMARRPAAALLHLGPGLANALSNLHNARKARSPVVAIVGQHSTLHLLHDAPLTADIEALARPVSSFVRTVGHAAEIGRDASAAVQAACAAPGRVATLIVPRTSPGAKRASLAPRCRASPRPSRRPRASGRQPRFCDPGSPPRFCWAAARCWPRASNRRPGLPRRPVSAYLRTATQRAANAEEAAACRYGCRISRSPPKPCWQA